MPSKTSARHLLVVAHPDDETLFFGGLIQSLKDWHVVSVTNGNADDLGPLRQSQFFSACRKLKVKKAQFLNFPDKFENRLDVNALKGVLTSLGNFKKVFTHSIVGEYGHPHHQDVSYAVHKAFDKISAVFSVAYNTYPEMKLLLTKKQFNLKGQILRDIYRDETKRFINFLPATSQENFVRLSMAEVEALYLWLSTGKPLSDKALQKYRWFMPYLELGTSNLKSRPF